MTLPWNREDFEFLSQIGKGAYGQVFRVKEISTQRDYAIKAIQIGPEITKESAERTHREVEVLFRLKDNPNITQSFGCWMEGRLAATYLDYTKAANIHVINPESDQTVLFIQMEYCEQTLEEWIRTNKNRTLDDCTKLMVQLLEGIVFIHSKGIIHRDIKPSNTLLKIVAGLVQVKIGDFGLSKLTIVNETGAYSKAVGTRFYRSPEVIKGEPYDNKTDIYSLGIIYYELLCTMSDKSKKNIFLSFQKGNSNSCGKYLDKIKSLRNEWELIRNMVSYPASSRYSAAEGLHQIKLFNPNVRYVTPQNENDDSGIDQSSSGQDPLLTTDEQENTLISKECHKLELKSEALEMEIEVGRDTKSGWKVLIGGSIFPLLVIMLLVPFLSTRFWNKSNQELEEEIYVPGKMYQNNCTLDNKFFNDTPPEKWIPYHQRPYNLTLYSDPWCGKLKDRDATCVVYRIYYNACTPITPFHARSAWARGIGCPGMSLWNGNNHCSQQRDGGAYHWIRCNECVPLEARGYNIQAVKCP